MITSLAVVPSAPVLLPRFTGRVDAGAGLRVLARQAVQAAVSVADEVVLVCATDREPRHSGASFGEQVGALLLADATMPTRTEVVAWDADVDECRARGAAIGASSGSARCALVVVADGSACRGEKAPGHLDQRSFGVDGDWLEAVGGVEPDTLYPAPMEPAPVRAAINRERLLGLDPALAADVMFHGRAPLQVMAAALGPALTAFEMHVGDPFGVRYVTLTAR